MEKIKILDIVNRVNKTKEFQSDVDVATFAHDALFLSNLDSYKDYGDRLTSYYVIHWICTDTGVGVRIFFLDDEPVAIGVKTARRDDEDIEFLSKESYEKVKTYLLSLIELNPSIMKEDDVIQEYYSLEYSSQLLKFHLENAYYDGEKVKIIKCLDGNTFPNMVKIELSNKTKKEVEVGHLKFKINILEE